MTSVLLAGPTVLPVLPLAKLNVDISVLPKGPVLHSIAFSDASRCGAKKKMMKFGWLGAEIWEFYFRRYFRQDITLVELSLSSSNFEFHNLEVPLFPYQLKPDKQQQQWRIIVVVIVCPVRTVMRISWLALNLGRIFQFFFCIGVEFSNGDGARVFLEGLSPRPPQYDYVEGILKKLISLKEISGKSSKKFCKNLRKMW